MSLRILSKYSSTSVFLRLRLAAQVAHTINPIQTKFVCAEATTLIFWANLAIADSTQ